VKSSKPNLKSQTPQVSPLRTEKLKSQSKKVRFIDIRDSDVVWTRRGNNSSAMSGSRKLSLPMKLDSKLPHTVKGEQAIQSAEFAQNMSTQHSMTTKSNTSKLSVIKSLVAKMNATSQKADSSGLKSLNNLKVKFKKGAFSNSGYQVPTFQKVDKLMSMNFKKLKAKHTSAATKIIEN